MFIFDKIKNLIPVQTNSKVRKNGDFLIVMNKNNNIHYLNSTAKFIYEHCDNNTTINTIFDLMKKEFEITPDMEEEVKNDFVSIIRDFQWQKIIDLKKVSS